jgi:hypothetical protein
MGEAAQLAWLEALVAAHGEAYARACALGAGGADLGPRLISVLAGTGEWAVLHVRHCFRLYKSRLHDKCWGCLEEFFAGLRACTAPRSGDAEGGAADGWAGMSEETRVDRVVLQRSCQAMLAIAARVWTPQRHAVPPPSPPTSPLTKWTRRVPHPVLIGHAASLTPYYGGRISRRGSSCSLRHALRGWGAAGA